MTDGMGYDEILAENEDLKLRLRRACDRNIDLRAELWAAQKKLASRV